MGSSIPSRVRLPLYLYLSPSFQAVVLRSFSLTVGAHTYGLTSTPREATFYPAVAIRNVSLGITILSLVATGQPHALGTLLLGFSVMAVGDMVIVLRTPGVERVPLAMHATKLILMPLVSAKLLNWW